MLLLKFAVIGHNIRLREPTKYATRVWNVTYKMRDDSYRSLNNNSFHTIHVTVLYENVTVLYENVTVLDLGRYRSQIGRNHSQFRT